MATKNKPSDYKVIAAYGQLMGSFQYYINNEQEKAANENAPLDATYKGRDGEWATLSNYPTHVKRKIETFL